MVLFWKREHVLTATCLIHMGIQSYKMPFTKLVIGTLIKFPSLISLGWNLCSPITLIHQIRKKNLLEKHSRSNSFFTVVKQPIFLIYDLVSFIAWVYCMIRSIKVTQSYCLNVTTFEAIIHWLIITQLFPDSSNSSCTNRMATGVLVTLRIMQDTSSYMCDRVGML